MRRPVGLDLNGWHDFACRDWHLDDPDERTDAPELIDGGFGAVIVETDGISIGGPQATLSPIGRGNGWGEVGARDRRRDLAGLWRSFLAGTADGHFGGDMRAAADALSMHAGETVLCMPDRAAMDEARQHTLLTALQGPRRPTVTLLWRPVALLLDLLDSGELPGAADGMRIVCAIHAQEGVEVQHLVLRRLDDHPGYLAPERSVRGELLFPELGLAQLLEHARQATANANPALGTRPAETPRMPLDLLFRDPEPPIEEVVRRDNGNWTLVTAPAEFHLPTLPQRDVLHVAVADMVLVMSPLARRHQGWLGERLSELGQTLRLTHPAAAARGALRAARRIERGIPHYLDRLDQISLAVLRQGGPVFEDLIPAGETVCGNQEYFSPPITSMVWRAGMKTAQFFVRKGEREIRCWVTPETPPPECDQLLEVRLRQKPAQGWAKLFVTAVDWDELRRTPIRLDWTAMEIDARSANEILAMLEGPRPVVPRRVHHPADIGMWDGSLRPPGLISALQALNINDQRSLRALAAALSGSARLLSGRTVFAVGTDGDLPVTLDPQTRHLFFNAIERLTTHLLGDVARGKPQEDNQILRCLTWINGLCPETVKAHLITAMGCSDVGKSHPLLVPRAARRVIVHGLGRVTIELKSLHALIGTLCGRLYQVDCLGAFSSLLSRPADTPRVLAGFDVDTIAQRLTNVFHDLRQAGTYGVAMKYALLSVGGLLRVREHDPWALVADRSTPARALVEVLTEVGTDIGRRRQRIPAGQSKFDSAHALIDLLSGAGGRPDILTIMDEMPDS